MSRPLCWSFSIVKQLEPWSACFGRYCRNWLNFTTLQTYSWQLKTVYCKLHVLMKMVSCKVMMMEMSVLTATPLISADGAIWINPGCWHQMYPHINKSTWPKCWPNVKLMLCSVTLAHQRPILVGYIWLNVSLTQSLTKCQDDLM